MWIQSTVFIVKISRLQMLSAVAPSSLWQRSRSPEHCTLAITQLIWKTPVILCLWIYTKIEHLADVVHIVLLIIIFNYASKSEWWLYLTLSLMYNNLFTSKLDYWFFRARCPLPQSFITVSASCYEGMCMLLSYSFQIQFQIFLILKINRIMPFCNLFIKRPSYVLYSVVLLNLCQAFYCPIDTSLSFVQANKLIRELSPAHVVISRQYTVPPKSYSQRQDLVIDCVSVVLYLQLK